MSTTTTSLHDDVNRLIALVALIRPDLVARLTPEEVRREATVVELSRRWRDRPEQDR